MTTVTLYPTADTWIDSINEDGNHGSLTYLDIGKFNVGGAVRHALINFGVLTSALPADAVISSVVLSIYATQDFASGAGTIGVYRLKKTWVQGTGNGFDPVPDGATWDTTDGSTGWGASGALGTEDSESTPIGSLALTATETLNAYKNIPLSVTTRAALDLGYGFLVRQIPNGLSNGYRYSSSRAGGTTNDPYLTITYTVPEYKPLTVDARSTGLTLEPGRVALTVSTRSVALTLEDM